MYNVVEVVIMFGSEPSYPNWGGLIAIIIAVVIIGYLLLRDHVVQKKIVNFFKRFKQPF